MGIYDITGWSGGGRRPINYGLKAGQFRGMGRVNVFPSSTTIVNNNIIGGGGCYSNSYDCGCNNGGSNKFMNWMLGIGVGSTLLGGILSMFGIGGGQKTEGAGGKEEKAEVKKEETPKEPSKLDQARKTLDSLGMTKDNGYTVSVDEDGKITYHYNKDGIDVEADNVTDLIDKINKAKNKDNNSTTPLDEVDETVETPTETPEDIQTPGSGNKPNASTRTGTGTPAGWYRAVNDGQELKAEKAQLEAAQKAGKNPAQELVNNLLDTKLGNVITDADKKELLATVIKKNPSVFNADGTLKDGADVSKLDVPTKEWMEKEYNVQVLKENADGTNTVVKKRVEGHSTRERRKAADGTYHQYDSATGKQLNDKYANGTQLSGKDGFTAVVWSDGSNVTYRQNGKPITDKNQVPQDLRQQVIKEMVRLRKGGTTTAASSQSAPPPSGNAQHVLTNGQKVNISGAKVGKNPKANASQKDTFYLQTSDGQKINISRMDYINIQKKIES